MNKYIIIKSKPIIFPKDFRHIDIALGNGQVESAGFFIITKNHETQEFELLCTGESSTLRISSRPEIDKELILAHFSLNELL